jgi:hypothetical protein
VAHGAAWGARAGRARGAVTVRSSHLQRYCGALTGGSVVAGQRQGAAGELTGATERAPGKAVGVELTRAVTRHRGGGGCFGRRRSSAGRELRWPVAMEA